MTNVFDQMAARLREYGWIKRSYGNPDTGYCVMGAMGHSCTFASASLSELREIERTLCRATSLITDGRLRDPIKFNDEPETTFEDITLMLKYASELWDAETFQPATGPSSG